MSRYTTEEQKRKKSEADKRYRAKNRDKLVAKCAAWRKKNPDARREYYDKNADRERKMALERVKNNPELAREKARLRKRVKNASPLSKIFRKEILEVYAERDKRGPGHVVDHVIPLRGKTVCGLHVPWNLQILTESKNCEKSNKLYAEFAHA